MEIFTNLTACPKCGNYYNASNHAACPLCSGQQSSQSTGSFGPTVDPSAAQTAPNAEPFSPTIAPGAAQPSAAPIGATEPLNNPHISQPGSEPFSPTMSVGQASSSRPASVEPVVGWLVCVEGPMRGNDYRIREGYNYIGREIGDIHIRGDQTISRQRHAKIAYDAETHQYFFSPDEGRNLLRVNGKTIMVPVELHNYDILTVGQTKLLFIGLCGEQFAWEQE